MNRLAAVVVLALALAAPATAAPNPKHPLPHPHPHPRATPPGFPAMPKAWSHADINVTINGHSHTLGLDRGTVTRATPHDVRLRERDGTTVDVPITHSTVLVLVGKKNKPNDGIVVGMIAWTLRVDGGPAVRVRAGYGI